MQTIQTEELKSRLDAGEKPVLLDVREAWEFSICKIEGSINISMSDPEKLIKELNTNDEIIEEKGVKLFVDPGAIMYLLGTEMDYKKEEFSSSFVFKNPNETERCGCGESFKI